MKHNKTKKEYVEVEVEKINFSKEDIVTYSWDENVSEDGWQQF